MREDKLIKRIELSKQEALNMFKDDLYKLDLIERMNEEDTVISAYKQDDFIDLCRGPHMPTTKSMKYFKLIKFSGAYWKGDSKNKMLQRIYGICFENEDDLNEYLQELEEAKFYIDQPAEFKGKWSEMFKRKQPLHIELGCGKGIFSATLASNHRENNYIAVDMIEAMLGLSKRNIEEKYKNQLYRSEAMARVVRLIEMEDAYETVCDLAIREVCDTLQIQGGAIIYADEVKNQIDFLSEHCQEKDWSLAPNSNTM